MFFNRFRFIDPGPLVDDDLELVAPELALIDEVMTSVTHPLTQANAPADSQVTHEQLTTFVKNNPHGQEPANIAINRVSQYHFWMRLREPWWGRPQSPPVRMVGGIGLRMGSTPTIEMYYGHFGYHVFPAARGRHYALRACRLLLPLARYHGYKQLWITCNPENIASRRTVEALGAKLVEVIPVPDDEPLFARGELWKCRYRLDLRGVPRLRPVS